jgi:hypothetical protein
MTTILADRFAEALSVAGTKRVYGIVGDSLAKGFTLFMVKAVMSGRRDELLDLAKTNLWR